MPTDKQVNLIKQMEFALDVKFTGNTKEEASHFIGSHMQKYVDHLEFLYDMTYNENNY